MSHHAEHVPEDMQKRIREMFGNVPLGDTGRYPDGQFAEPDDEGEIQFGIAGDTQSGNVVISFGKPVAWLSMTPQEAVDVASVLIKQARRMAPVKVVLS